VSGWGFAQTTLGELTTLSKPPIVGWRGASSRPLGAVDHHAQSGQPRQYCPQVSAYEARQPNVNIYDRSLFWLYVMLSVAVCTGTSFGLRRTGHAGNWSLQRYIRMYQNCVYVDGNLELTFLENGSYDLSFLSSIQEVKYA